MAHKNYLAAFQRLANALEAHPETILLGYHSFAPLSASAIAELEARYKCQLDKPMRQFYQQSNGLQLRWMLRSNPAYDPERYPAQLSGTVPKPWDYATQAHRAEKGSIFLLPLEKMLQSYLPPSGTTDSLTIEGQPYGLIDFYTRLHVLDAFSYYLQTGIFFREGQAPLLLLGDEEGTCFTDAVPVTFEAYLAFLVASKGWVLRRKEWLGQLEGHQAPPLTSLPLTAQWQTPWSMEQLLLARHFPLADQLPTPQPQVKTRQMQRKAAAQAPLTAEVWTEIVAAHQLFLESGGLQGHWKPIAIQGRALGIYQCSVVCEGQQAVMDLQRLDKGLEFQELYLPCSSWCGVYAKGQDWSDANLTNSLLTDAHLENAIFAETNLENADFSRSNLKGASFMNANLAGADFENCNLTNADFRGSNRQGANFKGATLHNIRY